jgi:protein-S-isoprenylcysteine O-methyltransferase Ste14
MSQLEYRFFVVPSAQASDKGNQTMNTSESSDGKQSQKAGIFRWLSLIMLAVGIAVVHILLPWIISLLSTRFGWVDGRPGLLNLLALILVAAGLAVVIWCSALHYSKTPRGMWDKVKDYLLVRGPYKFSRNPMYLFELVMWLGWTLFYGSLPVLVALVMWGAFFAFIQIPSEERAIEAHLGEAYLQYKKTVPRWIGKVRR